MAMGPVKGRAATLQVEMVCVDELVAADDRLRGLDELVGWGFVRAEAAPYYAAEVGRPSVDPIVLVKLMLVGALEGIDSMRELLRVAAVRVDIRRFLGYGFSERLPVHQTISHAQTRRFVDAKLFERLFLRSVALCRGARSDRGHAPVRRRLSCRGRRGAGEPAREPGAGKRRRSRRRFGGNAGRVRARALRRARRW